MDPRTSEPTPVAASWEEGVSQPDQFNQRVDQAELANPPTKKWVGRAIHREGASRCPIRLKRLSYDVILRCGDTLADLVAESTDVVVLVAAYDPSVGYPPCGLDGPISTIRVLTDGATWTDEWGTRWGHAAGGVGASRSTFPWAIGRSWTTTWRTTCRSPLYRDSWTRPSRPPDTRPRRSIRRLRYTTRCGAESTSENYNAGY